MQFQKIDRLPDDTQRNSRTSNNNIQRLLMDFYESDAEYAEVNFNFGEYSTSQSLYSGLRKSIQRLQLPVEVQLIQGGIYLSRTD